MLTLLLNLTQLIIQIFIIIGLWFMMFTLLMTWRKRQQQQNVGIKKIGRQPFITEKHTGYYQQYIRHVSVLEQHLSSKS